MAKRRVDQCLSRAWVVLVRPQIPANIGAAARAIKNMGLGGLIVVRPKRWHLGKMCAMAVRTGRDIILEELKLATTLAEAVREFHLVVGTTARTGKFRKPHGPPRTVMAEAAGVIGRGRVALVFGPEDKGLTAEEVRLCDRLVLIPVDEAARSINLAQAVMILAYELRLAALAAHLDEPVEGPKLATSAEVQGMYRHLEETLVKLDPHRHHNLAVWMEGFRRLLGRTQLAPHEVQLIRGFCRKVAWAVEYGNQGPDDDRPAAAEAGR